LRLDNDRGGKTWTVLSFGLAGASPGLQVAMEQPGFPRDLMPGSSLHANVTVDRHPPGVRHATVQFTVRGPMGQLATVSGTVEARVQGPAILWAAPTVLDFFPGERPRGYPSNPNLPMRKALLLANDGSIPLERQGVVLQGDVAQFRVFQGGTVLPLAPQRTIASGESEVLTVAYCPTETNAVHHATITIYYMDGSGSGQVPTAAVTLQGHSPSELSATCLVPH
jgi:hypothetical protein